MSYGCDETPTPRASAPAGGPLVVGTAADNSRLVDADGLTLYVFDNDSPGESACNSGCADTWPPLVLAAGQELQAQPDIAEGFSTFIRGDGATQVAYTGRPLYRFSGDSSPGDVNGDGIGGVWHIATP
jgi:predicted lipoprotein with Yx(FWY)xxD motif